MAEGKHDDDIVWVKNTSSFPDYVFTPDGILIVRLVPLWMFFSIVLAGIAVLWLVLGEMLLWSVLFSIIFSGAITSGIGILKRRRIATLNTRDLTSQSGVTRIEWSKVRTVILRTLPFSIWTASGRKYFGVMSEWNIKPVAEYINNKTNAIVVVGRRRWSLFILFWCLLFGALISTLDYLPLGIPVALEAVSIMLLILFIARPRKDFTQGRYAKE